MSFKRTRKTALAALVFLAATLGGRGADLAVKVGDKTIALSAHDLELLPHLTVKAADHGGQQAEWTGVPVYQILQQAGQDFGESMRGAALARYVLVTAADGYRAVYALPELDPHCTDDPVILATEMNGAPLSAEAGPLRMILPKERRQFRWVRQVVKIEVLAAP
jgi:DMSO/TMAO reductase YedYZ molybdopterin-dependent catalytic subunit